MPSAQVVQTSAIYNSLLKIPVTQTIIFNQGYSWVQTFYQKLIEKQETKIANKYWRVTP